jgi:tetratricopeptide (TPR) repeat protein
MFSTAGHLTHWAIFLARFAGEDNQSPAETAALLERALTASPINPAARLALAQLERAQSTGDVSIRSLGLSRDAVSLAWTARRLLAAGKKEDALKLYGRALSVAVPALSSRSPVPGFIEDPGIRRYLLPGEEQVREIVADLVSQNAWTFAEWSGALPETPIVLIATARLLREKGRGEAETVLDRLLENKAIAGAPDEAAPIALAARAEALALRSRWKEADQLYRQAIDSIGDPTIARSWWFNLAEISYRADDEAQRQAALRSASAVASSDDITVRAALIQRASLPRSNGVKAN